MKHKQVRIRGGRHWDDELGQYFDVGRVTVDEGLAKFLPLLWRRCIATMMSCQENAPNITWIAFPYQWDADRFSVYMDELGLSFHQQLHYNRKLTTEEHWHWSFCPQWFDDVVYPSFISVRFHKKFIDIIRTRTEELDIRNTLERRKRYEASLA